MSDTSPYRLVVLTHRPGSTLARALAAFEEHAEPAPAEVQVVVDGPEFGYSTEALTGRFKEARVTIWPDTQQRGFCAATARAWKHAADGPGPPYVFYLEHDFVLTRDVDLSELAAVLDGDRSLAQMALVRNAVNDQEKAAGGLVESRLGQFDLREHNGRPWLEHVQFFTTNPSLMRRDFMAENPWLDDGEPFCEGRFGIGLRDRGYSFGFYGNGEIWCEHVGIRTGTGY